MGVGSFLSSLSSRTGGDGDPPEEKENDYERQGRYQCHCLNYTVFAFD